MSEKATSTAPRGPMTTKTILLHAILAGALLFPLGATPRQNAPAADNPLSLPARDAHQNLTVAADPYLSATRYKKEVFGKKSPYDAGIVAIDVYLKNDNDLPIRVNPETVELIISQPGQDRQRLGALSPEDVADRALLTGNSNVKAPRRLPIPIPIPSSGSRHTKEWTEMTTALRAVALGTDLLGPHSTTHGFLFFDLDHDFGAIHNSRLYIPDLTFMTTHQALFFFEIDLADAPTR
jgi:hypothetical protein